MFKLGDKATDTITGFTGVVRKIVEHPGGPRRIYLEAPRGAWDTIVGLWFPESQLRLTNDE